MLLVHLLMRLHEAEPAAIFIDGIDHRRVSLHSLRSQIGVVPSTSCCSTVSARDNIGYGRPGREPGHRASGPPGTGARIHHRVPQGYDTIIGDAG